MPIDFYFPLRTAQAAAPASNFTLAWKRCDQYYYKPLYNHRRRLSQIDLVFYNKFFSYKLITDDKGKWEIVVSALTGFLK